MKKLLFILFGLLAFSTYSQVIVTKEVYDKLPESTKQQLLPDTTSTVIETLKETSEAVSIGREIGTAVNETLTAVSDNVIKVSESDIGRTAIGVAMWKLLWKDIVGIVVGSVLLGFSMYFGIKATRKLTENEDEDEDDLLIRMLISGSIASILFIASMCCIFA